LDALQGDKKSGGIKDGTPVILFKWKKQENQIWKLTPACKSPFFVMAKTILVLKLILLTLRTKKSPIWKNPHLLKALLENRSGTGASHIGPIFVVQIKSTDYALDTLLV
jgi:hypothetical protein